MNFFDLLLNIALQLVFAVGLICICGYLIGKVSRLFYRLSGYKLGSKIEMATGLIGTPVHELGHAVMCLLFAHKIVEIKLYQLNSDDGTLGYVRHTYSRTNVWARIGNFFIGLGPILFGSIVLLFVMGIAVPDVLASTNAIIGGLMDAPFDLVNTLGAIVNVLATVFDVANLALVGWWIFLIVSCSIALHMRISSADIKSGVGGFTVIAGLLCAVDGAFALFYPPAVVTITDFCIMFGVFVLSFLWIALLLALVLLAVGALIKLGKIVWGKTRK